MHHKISSMSPYSGFPHHAIYRFNPPINPQVYTPQFKSNIYTALQGSFESLLVEIEKWASQPQVHQRLCQLNALTQKVDAYNLALSFGKAPDLDTIIEKANLLYQDPVTNDVLSVIYSLYEEGALNSELFMNAISFVITHDPLESTRHPLMILNPIASTSPITFMTTQDGHILCSTSRYFQESIEIFTKNQDLTPLGSALIRKSLSFYCKDKETLARNFHEIQKKLQACDFETISRFAYVTSYQGYDVDDVALPFFYTDSWRQWPSIHFEECDVSDTDSNSSAESDTGARLKMIVLPSEIMREMTQILFPNTTRMQPDFCVGVVNIPEFIQALSLSSRIVYLPDPSRMEFAGQFDGLTTTNHWTLFHDIYHIWNLSWVPDEIKKIGWEFYNLCCAQFEGKKKLEAQRDLFLLMDLQNTPFSGKLMSETRDQSEDRMKFLNYLIENNLPYSIIEKYHNIFTALLEPPPLH